MTRGRRLGAAVVALGLTACLEMAGCGHDPATEPGVVAVIGGEPIRLADLQARHDLAHVGVPEIGNPTVERLRAAYGNVLADMIVARLAAQDLARRGLTVTKADIDAAEDTARADYSEAAFSRLLLEERIDYARWRQVLADRLALEKLSREVLRPGIRVDVTKAARYYKDHIDAFAEPARVRLLRVTGDTPEALKTAWAAARKSGPSAVSGLAGITTAQAELPEANVPADCRDAVKGLTVGEVSAIVPQGGGAFYCVLARRPASVLPPAKAYARVEAALAADKLETAFAAWLDAALATGNVRVSRHLAQPGSGPEAPATDELTLTREEGASRGSLAREARKVLAQKSPPAPTAEPVRHTPNEVIEKSLPAAEQGQSTRAAPPPAQEDATQPESTPQAQTVPAPPQTPPATPTTAATPRSGEIVFTAIKASWILYTADDGQEQRTYLKPGKPFTIAYTQKLVVRPGSPSELSYRRDGQETTVVVGKKESRVLEFP